MWCEGGWGAIVIAGILIVQRYRGARQRAMLATMAVAAQRGIRFRRPCGRWRPAVGVPRPKIRGRSPPTWSTAKPCPTPWPWPAGWFHPRRCSKYSPRPAAGDWPKPRDAGNPRRRRRLDPPSVGEQAGLSRRPRAFHAPSRRLGDAENRPVVREDLQGLRHRNAAAHQRGSSRSPT